MPGHRSSQRSEKWSIQALQARVVSSLDQRKPGVEHFLLSMHE